MRTHHPFGGGSPLFLIGSMPSPVGRILAAFFIGPLLSDPPAEGIFITFDGGNLALSNPWVVLVVPFAFLGYRHVQPR